MHSNTPQNAKAGHPTKSAPASTTNGLESTIFRSSAQSYKQQERLEVWLRYSVAALPPMITAAEGKDGAWMEGDHEQVCAYAALYADQMLKEFAEREDAIHE